jgi:hypothetical protein
MFQIFRYSIAYILIIAALLAVPAEGNAQNYRAQDVIAVDKQIRFKRGEIFAFVTGRIARGTTHHYRVRARAGQRMAVVLKSGRRTSFTVYGNQTGILEGADGVTQAVVELPETGEFLIEIGTDAAANYRLEVAIK